MTNIVELHNAGVSLGGRRVLAGIDLTLAPGDSLGVAGPNGSGKTTLVRTIATLVSIDEGEAEILGVDLASRDLTSVRASIGLIGHQPSLIDELTLHENLDHVARLAGVEPERVPKALDVVGLAAAADRRAAACSFGMKRRVEIAHLLSEGDPGPLAPAAESLRGALRRYLDSLALLSDPTTSLAELQEELLGALPE